MSENKETKKEKKSSGKKDAPKKEKNVTTLKDIGSMVGKSKPEAAPAQVAQKETSDAPKERVAKLDDRGRAYATGRRKNAIARVWLQSGTGKVVVNGSDQAKYFTRHTHRLILNQPFLVVDRVGRFDVICTVTGGGLSGQAGAVRHGISRALENFDPALRPPLKKAGMMTRDDRIVERKKVGKHGARRTKQWAKR